jgi:hypothetical protein
MQKNGGNLPEKLTNFYWFAAKQHVVSQKITILSRRIKTLEGANTEAEFYLSFASKYVQENYEFKAVYLEKENYETLPNT